jgi:hypothetical protein
MVFIVGYHLNLSNTSVSIRLMSQGSGLLIVAVGSVRHVEQSSELGAVFEVTTADCERLDFVAHFLRCDKARFAGARDRLLSRGLCTSARRFGTQPESYLFSWNSVPDFSANVRRGISIACGGYNRN